MDYPRFSTEQVAAAAGIPVATLGTWLKRGAVQLLMTDKESPADVAAPGTGRGRLFTKRSVFRVAIIARLSRIGLPVAFADFCAMTFMDFGDGAAGYGNEEIRLQRLPGDFYAEGGTGLRVDFPANADPRVSVVRLSAMSPSDNCDGAYLLLDLEALARATDKALATA